MTTPGAKRILKARQEAAAELKIDVSDWRVKRTAVLRVALDDIQQRLAVGADYDIDVLLKIEAAIQEIRQSLPPPSQTITVEIVRSLDAALPNEASVSGLKRCRRCHWTPPGSDRATVCWRCGWRKGDDVNAKWKPMDAVASSDPAGAEIEGEIVPEPAASARAALPPPKAKQDVKREPRHPGSIHDQPGVPLKRYDEPWRG